MDITIFPSKLHGNINIIPSKSQAHRILICSAFSDKPTHIICPQTNEDIEATVRCLQALGAQIYRTEEGYQVFPVVQIPGSAQMDCGESGSTLRFILPIVCALGVKATIYMHGRLPERPLSPLWEELQRMGCMLYRPTYDSIQTTGKLRAGKYVIPGNISSQYITGLLFALSLLEGNSQIIVTGKMESAPYVAMTQSVLSQFGVETEGLSIGGKFPFYSPEYIRVEGDWSNGAFFLTAKALGSSLTIDNLTLGSTQGDKAIAEILQTNDNFPTICAADIPDLVPILAVYFAARKGAIFTDIARLRLKESDRVASVSKMLKNLGIKAQSDENTMTVFPGCFTSGIVDAAGDHRIAMAAAIAATIAEGPLTILGAQCVAKSYPTFWQEYARLGGNYEQYIR